MNKYRQMKKERFEEVMRLLNEPVEDSTIGATIDEEQAYLSKLFNQSDIYYELVKLTADKKVDPNIYSMFDKLDQYMFSSVPKRVYEAFMEYLDISIEELKELKKSFNIESFKLSSYYKKQSSATLKHVEKVDNRDMGKVIQFPGSF